MSKVAPFGNNWLSPGVCSKSSPLSRWCHPTIWSSVAPFSSCLQFFSASESFPMSQLFASGTGASVLTSVLPVNIQGWFPLGLTSLISLLSKGLSRVFSSPTGRKHQFFSTQTSLWFNSQIPTWLLEEPSFDFVSKVMSLLFNMLSRFVTAFLPRSKCLLLSWLQSPSAVILEPKKIKVCHCFHYFPPIWHEVIGLDAIIVVF